MVSLWWVWMAFAVALAIVEVLSPGFIFLGFAIGAAVTGALVGLGMVPSGAVLAVIFAVVSVVAWLVLRQIFRPKDGDQVKIIDKDINEG